MSDPGPYSQEPPTGGSPRGRHRAAAEAPSDWDADPQTAPYGQAPPPADGDTGQWPAADGDAGRWPGGEGDTGQWPAGGDAGRWSDGPDTGRRAADRWADEPGGPDEGHAGHPADPGAYPTGALPRPAGGADAPTGLLPTTSAQATAAPAADAPPPAVKRGRAGRNLPAAIGVGVGMGAVVLASLFIWQPAFLLVLVVGVVIGTWEMTRALGRATDPAKRARPPLIPLLVGAVVTEGMAWFAGLEALTVGLLFTVVALVVWRLADGAIGYRRDIVAGTLVATYVAFLAGFGVLLARPEDGASRVVMALAMVVCSDTGGYAVGVFLGKHRMAPGVSPGKSWEGFGGSVLTCAIAGSIMLTLIFDRPWWYGAIFGVAVSLVSVLGDLAESLLKRDLGIKDMGQLLPGHGGLMDRLDSILFALPVSFALLTVLAPAAG